MSILPEELQNELDEIKSDLRTIAYNIKEIKETLKRVSDNQMMAAAHAQYYGGARINNP